MLNRFLKLKNTLQKMVVCLEWQEWSPSSLNLEEAIECIVLIPKGKWHVSCLFFKFEQAIVVRVLMPNF